MVMGTELAAAILMERLVRASYPEKRSSSVQPLQWSILRYLNDSESTGRDLSSIAKYVGVTAAPASRAVATLEKRGLLTKRTHPNNARTLVIQITKNGMEFLENDPMLILASRLRALSSRERATFIKTLRALSLNPASGPLPEDDDNTCS